MSPFEQAFPLMLWPNMGVKLKVVFKTNINEPRCEKTNVSHTQQQRPRSASR